MHHVCVLLMVDPAKSQKQTAEDKLQANISTTLWLILLCLNMQLADLDDFFGTFISSISAFVCKMSFKLLVDFPPFGQQRIVYPKAA